ncbi:MAG: chromosome segregation protein SMC [Zoogloeaceae bacterium]|nr:chromosome segregation protein SMC [Zoogloeaceae bacterium]
MSGGCRFFSVLFRCLTRLKLSGFKSFVDPTTVVLPGQLVGVVGPNGCGKSNIMDAVRWVLGESKASELRGESMQDVIFNGSTNRKPAARSSVELVFDNSLGRAQGQWSQYAELAVKRVLTRNGQSDYFINNLKVRRKDITDLFLGTGLGPRAYAIIGQGMISRVIEARPDDLRVFLEEAAGVTRYKERRKETEGRLEDTRENLSRVEDIRQELAARMETLEAQAEVARRYHECNDALARKQRLLWLARQGEALLEQESFRLEVDRMEVEQEGTLSALRGTETRLEAAREAHFSAGDAVQRAQADLYAAKAEVTRLETEIRHQKEKRQQTESRLSQLGQEERRWLAETERLASDRQRWEELREAAAARLAEAAARHKTVAERLPQLEAEESAARTNVETLRRNAAQLEQRLQVELAHRANASRALQKLMERQERLQKEAGSAGAEMIERFAREREAKEEERARMAERLSELEARLQNLRDTRFEQETRRSVAVSEMARLVSEMAALEARHETLTEMQEKQGGGEDRKDWLRRQGLADALPLWRALKVDAGWETAVAAILRERLETLPIPKSSLKSVSGWRDDRPDSRVHARLEALTHEGSIAPDSLRARVATEDESWRGLLNLWLGGVRTAENLEVALKGRSGLALGECFVTPAGDIVEGHTLALFAPDAADSGGFLERRQEIEGLTARLEELRAKKEVSQREADALAREGKELEEKDRQFSLEQKEMTAKAHALQLEILRLDETETRQRERQERLESSERDLEAETKVEREREREAEEAGRQLREELDHLHNEASAARLSLDESTRILREARESATLAERELREAEFSGRECAGKLEEIAVRQNNAALDLERVRAELAECHAMKPDTPSGVLEEALQAALEKYRFQENEMASCRASLEAATSGLRALEEERMRLEQALVPLRERIGDLKLKEQAAGINARQLAEQLLESGCNEVELAMLSEEVKRVKPQALTQEIGRLQKTIAGLGLVNLAALEELENARERRGFLDEQAADLTEAMEILEAAIRRIDRETRDLLQNTFDTINGHFGRLFPELFGGGKAALVMTGEEILDTGVQVFAQPPGKKNSTIHLLSGGEKALTAIALVFSIFLLNPAPFCLLDEVDAPLDDSNTERFCQMVKKMSGQTQFLFISHNKISMEMAEQLVGVTMQESGVSRVVEVDREAALKMAEEV